MRRLPTDLEASIMRTILWFSVFSYPVTLFEIWKWLFEPERSYDLAQVSSALRTSDWLQERIQVSGGFYALDSVDLVELVRRRHERFQDAEQKYRLLKRVIKWFQVLPGVRATAVVNTLSFWATNKQSDIDFFIVTRPGTIWSTRFWLVLPFLLTGKRPRLDEVMEKPENPFCFSFFASQEHLLLEDLCLERDYYMAFWVKSVVPMWDRDGNFERFHSLNRWASRIFPNASPRASHPYHRVGKTPPFLLQPSVLEPGFAGVQKRRMPPRLIDRANEDSCVVVHDGMLKFHVNDRRAQFRDFFEELLVRYL